MSSAGAGSLLADDLPGKATYQSQCRRCHGEDGAGKTAMGRRLNAKDYSDPAVQDALTDEAFKKSVIEGYKDPTSGREVMPGAGDKINAEQLADLLAYFRTLRKS